MEECINIVDQAFMYSIRKTKSFLRRTDSEALYSIKTSMDDKDRFNFKETIFISQNYQRFKRKLTLKEEINANILAKNDGYFDLIRHVFEVHFSVLIKEFNEAIPIYFMQENVAKIISGALLDPELTVNQAKTAITFTLIHHFYLFEELIESYYPKYVRLLKKTAYSGDILGFESSYINLQYSPENLEIIYNTLQDNQLINSTFLEFKTYFSPRTSNSKMVWYGTEVALVILIMGQNNIRGLKILSKDPLKIIPQFFIKPDGSEFRIGQLRVVYQKTPQKPRGTDSILALLHAINS